MEEIVICVLVLILSELVVGGITYFTSHRKKAKRTFSFRDGFDLTELPIIPFTHNDLKLNFLLDTGSTDSVINQGILEQCKCERSQNKTRIMGMEGNPVLVNKVYLDIARNDIQFREEFQVVDMSRAFAELKQATGVSVHGILGNTFFTRYKAVLDFDNYTAYFK